MNTKAFSINAFDTIDFCINALDTIPIMFVANTTDRDFVKTAWGTAFFERRGTDCECNIIENE